MCEKERVLLEKIAQLPPEVQDRMADQLEGAVIAVQVLKAAQPQSEDQRPA